MTEWPYDEVTPVYSFQQEEAQIIRHLENFHYYDYKYPSWSGTFEINQVKEVEWKYYIVLEQNLMDGLIWG